MPTAPSLDQPKTETSRRPRRRPHLQEAGLLTVILLIGILLATLGGSVTIRGETHNTFLWMGNLVGGVATPMTMYAIMAVGMTFVIISGGIDISVGAVFALAALGAAAVLQEMPSNAPAWQTIPVAFGVAGGIGLICGLINGGLTVLLDVHSFVITLGMMSFYRSLGNRLVLIKTLPGVGKTLPASFTTNFMMWEWRPWLQPAPAAVMAICVAAGWVVLAYTIWGRQTYAVGGNEEAARFSGIPVGRVKLRAFLFAGLSAGIAGAVSLGLYGSASTNTGNGYELTVIAAAVVGGASLLGGRGTALGAMLGALVIKLIENAIIILHLLQENSGMIIGTAIICAVAIDRFAEQARQRRLTRAKPS